MNSRLYVNHIFDILNSDTKIRTYLSYLKIRYKSSGRCGGFTFNDLRDVLSLSDTSLRKHLRALLSQGYVSETSQGLYHVVAHHKLLESFQNERFITLTEEKLFSYSWKNIAEFKSELIEIRIQANRNLRDYKAKDRTEIDRHGVRNKIKGLGTSPLDTLMAASYTASMMDLSERTIFRYRKLQKSVQYSPKDVRRFHQGELQFDDSCNIISDLIGRGKFFIHKEEILFVGISERKGKVSIRGFSDKKKKKNVKESCTSYVTKESFYRNFESLA